MEYTANPVSSYPTSVTGERTLEHGDVIEGTAVTLVPYRVEGLAEPGERRSQLAHDLFVQGVEPGLPTGVLPLAMVSLDRGTVLWVDEWLVRREVGRDDVLGLTAQPRAQREAHLLHYRDHLEEVVAERAQRGARFAASEYFDALPPAGPMPAAAVTSDGDDLTSSTSPPRSTASCRSCPTTSCRRSSKRASPCRRSTSPAAAAISKARRCWCWFPVPRARFDSESAILEGRRLLLRPAIPGFFARRRPLDRLRGLQLRRLTPVVAQQSDPVIARWRQLLAAATNLVYVRRRHLRRWVATASAAVTSDQEVVIDMDRVELLKAHRLHALYRRVVTGNETDVTEPVLELVGSQNVADNRILLDGALRELETLREAGSVTSEEVEERARALRRSRDRPRRAAGGGDPAAAIRQPHRGQQPDQDRDQPRIRPPRRPRPHRGRRGEPGGGDRDDRSRDR